MKKCPKCGGSMKLPSATKSLNPQDYDKEGGAKLVCGKCGHRATSKELRSN